MATLELGIFYIIFRLSRNKDNETVRQLSWLRPTAPTPQQQLPTADTPTPDTPTPDTPTPDTTADTLPRNGLMVLMVLMVLKYETIKMVAAGSANIQRLKQQRGTRHRICSAYSPIRIND
ncbi:MAG: hypothetical protein IJN51_01860 [Alistipes sp.]|nr:hypothetical protein [Alistipes sp.]